MKTHKLLKIFNKKAIDWLSDLKGIDNQLIHKKPTENSWSYSEVYDHAMRVSRSYQIPNLKTSLTESAERRKRKNKYGIAVFNIGIRKNIEMKMENFPAPLVENFTPVKRSKNELIQDFTSFIQEVNDLEHLLNTSTKDNKHYHPMFGDISTKEWFALIELHMWQHDKQKDKIKKYLEAKSTK